MHASSAQVFLSLSSVVPVRAYRVKKLSLTIFACGCPCGKVIKIAVTDNPLSTECTKMCHTIHFVYCPQVLKSLLGTIKSVSVKLHRYTE